MSGVTHAVGDVLSGVVGSIIPKQQAAPAPIPAAPVAPAPAPAAPITAPAAVAPSSADQGAARAAAASDEIRKRAASGRASTILTSQTGVSAAPNLSSRTLLGL